MWRNKVLQRRFRKMKVTKILTECHTNPTYDNYMKLFKQCGIKTHERYIKLDNPKVKQ